MCSPFDRWFTWHVPRPLDVAAMRAAAGALVGRFDYTSFQAVDTTVRDSVRTMERLEIVEAPGSLTLEFEGDGFLRHMVRVMTGTLVEVGWGARRPTSMADLLVARDRTAAGRTAPARGLTLVKVRY